MNLSTLSVRFPHLWLSIIVFVSFPSFFPPFILMLMPAIYQRLSVVQPTEQGKKIDQANWLKTSFYARPIFVCFCLMPMQWRSGYYSANGIILDYSWNKNIIRPEHHAYQFVCIRLNQPCTLTRLLAPKIIWLWPPSCSPLWLARSLLKSDIESTKRRKCKLWIAKPYHHHVSDAQLCQFFP